MFGIAVSSSSPCVAARCAHARAGAGVVATQNITDPTLGPRGLDLMASGLSASEALERIKSEAQHIEYRQLALVDANGNGAAFSGANTLGTHRTVIQPNVVAAGNLLSSPAVPEKMAEAFLSMPEMSLGSRLIHAMQAALKAGGEEGPVHSVGMLLVRNVAWPVADLRVDWHETDPIGELAKLWELWEPQLEAYVSRGINPSVAPSYGVPGDM